MFQWVSSVMRTTGDTRDAEMLQTGVIGGFRHETVSCSSFPASNHESNRDWCHTQSSWFKEKRLGPTAGTDRSEQVQQEAAKKCNRIKY